MDDNYVTIELDNGQTIRIPKKNIDPSLDIDAIKQKDKEPFQLREENVQEILTAVPHWMIRRGNILFFTLIFLMIAIAWFVKYPDVVSAEATIVNKFPAQEIFLEPADEIGTFLVLKGQLVKKGTPLIVLKSNANYQDVMRLRKEVDAVQLNSYAFEFAFQKLGQLTLGNLQTAYAQFEESYFQYLLHEKEIQEKRNQIYSQAVASGGNKTNHLSYFKKVIEDFNYLKAAVQTWEKEHLILADIGGNILEINFGKTQKVKKRKPVITIVPEQSSKYVAMLEVPAVQLRKLAPAQKVNIKLSGYPELEFGMLEGEISAISKNPNDNNTYRVEVALPQQLVSSYNIGISYQQDLSGVGEIITRKHRLLGRFIPIMNTVKS